MLMLHKKLDVQSSNDKDGALNRLHCYYFESLWRAELEDLALEMVFPQVGRGRLVRSSDSAAGSG
jgi:hypothetical protein